MRFLAPKARNLIAWDANPRSPKHLLAFPTDQPYVRFGVQTFVSIATVNSAPQIGDPQVGKMFGGKGSVPLSITKGNLVQLERSIEMKTVVFLLLVLTAMPSAKTIAQNQVSNVAYADPSEERQVLDIFAPDGAKNLPVVFWIHGGGWQTGDKSDVQIKPQVFNDLGCVFVSTNYRLLPKVDMEVLIQDVAMSLAWVHGNIEQHGGDPARIFVMGHSAGAQLAALLCTDERYLKAQGVPFEVLRGCVPVDGDTYDLPAIIATAELRQTVHGLPLPQFGHRVKFGNDPEKHIRFSAVVHIAKGKNIPPFLILHVAGHPDTTAQAKRLGAVLAAADIPVRVFGASETTHNKLNQDLGKSDDLATQELFKFLAPLIERK